MKNIFLLMLLFTFAMQAEEKTIKHHEHDEACEHGHHDEAFKLAPIGVMGSHVHGEGELMFSYRFMFMEMEGLRDGTSRKSQNEELGYMMPMPGQSYAMLPRRMTMKMHMLGAMYGLTDDWTMTLMVPWLENDMDSSSRMMPMSQVNKFSTQSEGFGDVKIGSLYRFHKAEDYELIFNMTLSLPTGGLDEDDNTPMSMGQDVVLGYPMQLGSGTYDLMPGITLTGHNDVWGYGAQAIATFRLGRNSEEYSKGDALKINTWLSRKITENFSTSLRLELNSWVDYDGHDDELVGRRNMMPTADEDLRAVTRADALIGFTYLFTQGALAGNSIGLEVGMPFYQDIDGPNLETDYTVTLGWQVRF